MASATDKPTDEANSHTKRLVLPASYASATDGNGASAPLGEKSHRVESSDWLVEALFPFPPSPTLRFKLFVGGVVLPAIALTATATGSNWSAQWQSGKAEDFIRLLFMWPAIAPVLPLVALSMICLTAALIAPKLGRLAIVRLGVFSGALLAIVCLGLFWFSDRLRGVALTLVLAALVGSLLSRTIEAARGIKRLRKFTILHLALLTTLCGFLALAVKVGKVHESIPEIASILYWITLGATPLLAAIAHVRAAGIMWREQRAFARYRWRTMLWVGWCLAFAASVRWSVMLLLEEYARLPTTAPTNCYVSSAARHAFRDPPAVSLQTKRLKFVELSLKVTLPTVHRKLRLFYNRFGPPLAKICASQRWFARATYLALWPWEWLAEWLRRSLGIPSAAVYEMYTGKELAVGPANMKPR